MKCNANRQQFAQAAVSVATEWVVAYLFVYGLWVGLEIMLYNEIQPRAVDNIIGTILVWSLLSNYRHWRDKRC